LEVLPDDLTYQVWAITDGAPVGLGIFDAEEDGTATTEMETDLSGVDTVAITVEPAGGSDLPTTDPLLAAEL
jgi:anti-sigma-K factor RskA